jgi:endonuclease V-like protein UPF0215 family
MKSEFRVLGVDDAPFEFNSEKTSIIGVVMRVSGYLEGVIKKDITVDGNDATDTLIEMILNTRHRNQLKALLLDGVALGGFNVININKLYDETLLPIITVTRDEPEFDKIKDALQKHFDDWEIRYKILTVGKLHQITTDYNPIFVKCSGLSIDDAKEIIKLTTIRGVIPEPIRVAHIIASGITRGESYGKA